jgi:ZIP family zinc transporter
MLAANVVAPVVGAASTLLVRVPPGTLLYGLALFAGILLYMGVSDIVRQAHAGAAAARPALVATLLGVACIHAVAQLGGWAH